MGLSLLHLPAEASAQCRIGAQQNVKGQVDGRSDRCQDKLESEVHRPQGPHPQTQLWRPGPWLPTGVGGATRAHVPCRSRPCLPEAPARSPGEEKASNPSPAASLLGSHGGESRWNVLVKMRFLNVLWFHFHHLVPEGLAGQPRPPGSLPRPVPASRQEWPTPAAC